MKEYTKQVNSIYAYRTPFELLLSKRYRSASFAVFDVNTLITNIYNTPEKYLARPANVTGSYQVCEPVGGKCVDSELGLDHFLWFDELHPSEKVDEVIAKEFVKVVKGTSKFATYWKD